jgi:hypothetical protein
LLTLELRGNRLRDVPGRPALPAALAALRELRVFVAFEQSVASCPGPGGGGAGARPAGGAGAAPPGGRCSQRPARACRRDADCAPGSVCARADCRLAYHPLGTVAGWDVEPWQCRADGWAPRFDDGAQPWWGWASLEAFWVDANFFRGRIPAEMAARWPRLRNLDLYSNDLTGPVPGSVGALRQLHKFQARQAQSNETQR